MGPMPEGRGFWYRFGRGPGWADHLAAGLVFVVIMVLVSNPGSDLVRALFAGTIGVGVLMLLWFGRLTVASLRGGRGAFGPKLTRREIDGWLVLPALLLLGFSFTIARVPLHARFLLSEPALLRAARRSEAGPAGLYLVREVGRTGDVVLLATGSGEGRFEGGFAFASGAEPESGPRCAFRHLRGDWWTYRRAVEAATLPASNSPSTALAIRLAK